MAERQLACEDAATWRSQYERLREVYGTANVYVHNIRALVARAAQREFLSEEQRNDLQRVLAEIDADLRRIPQSRRSVPGSVPEVSPKCHRDVTLLAQDARLPGVVSIQAQESVERGDHENLTRWR